MSIPTKLLSVINTSDNRGDALLRTSTAPTKLPLFGPDVEPA